MNALALGIVLVAAFLHAGWNYLAKKSHNKIAFIWWAVLFSTIIFLPMFIYFWPSAAISAKGWACIIATGILHAFYFWFVGRAYERGDLSLVYPLSRGSAPMFVPIVAVLFLHEQLSALGILGIVLVILGIYFIHLNSFGGHAFYEPFRAMRGSASLYALCTGGVITGYSIVDKIGVSLVFPPVYIYLMFVITLLLLSPLVFARYYANLKTEWQFNRRNIVMVGFLDLFTYLMILFALQMSKVSYVAAAREVSIVFSAFFGIFWLKERNARQKFVGAVLISCGVVFIGLSR
jgi:drug/metabolite transporter (DMT)-like permease